MKTIKVTTDNKVSFVDVNFDDYKDIQRVIGGSFESVHTTRIARFFGEGVILLVDEDGLSKDLPVNLLGCFFYGAMFHRHPIVGDLILAKVVGEGQTAPDDVEALMDRLLKTFNLEEVRADGNEN